MQEAINALKAGDRERAFDLLRRHLASNPRDAVAWLWISEAAPRPEIQRDALERALHLAPDHPQAAMIRARLASLSGGTSAPAPTPAPASAPPPPAEPSTDEVMAQLRGESLRARPSEPAATLPNGEEDREVVAMGRPEPLAPAPTADEGAAIFSPEEEEPWATEEADGGADELVRNLRSQFAADEGWERPDQGETDGLMDESLSPIAPPQPAARKGTPWWVWLIVLISLLLVGAVVYMALTMGNMMDGMM